jgi:hypothetical protein
MRLVAKIQKSLYRPPAADAAFHIEVFIQAILRAATHPAAAHYRFSGPVLPPSLVRRVKFARAARLTNPAKPVKKRRGDNQSPITEQITNRMAIARG